MSNLFKAGRVIASDSKWTGEEPDWSGWELWPVEQFYRTRSRALMFYNYYLDSGSLRPAVLDWMKANGYTKDEISSIKEAPTHALPSTVGKLVRCIDRGMPSLHPSAAEYFSTLEFHDEPPVPKDEVDVIRHELAQALTRYCKQSPSGADEAIIQPPKPQSPYDRIRDRVHKEVFPHLENLLEVWSTTQLGTESLNLSALLRDLKIPSQGCKLIFDWVTRQHGEFNGALCKEDEELVEGYSHFAKTDLRKIVKTLEMLLSDVSTYAKIKTSARKPRKKKVKDATKQVSNIKYQTHSSDYSLDSVSPSRIPSSQLLCTFNTKTRSLGVYFASGPAGFEIKGTSLKGFDVSRSFSTTLRKPKETITAILSSTPKQLQKLYDSLTTKKKTPNGRINECTLLLKVGEQKL